jgi:hypothetical protein
MREIERGREAKRLKNYIFSRNFELKKKKKKREKPKN